MTAAALLKGFTIAIAFPLNVFLKTLETLLVEEVEDLVDLLSESESESVFGLHLVGRRIGSGELSGLSGQPGGLGARFLAERLSGRRLASLLASLLFTEDFLRLSAFLSGETGLTFCGDSEDTRLLVLGFNFPENKKSSIRRPGEVKNKSLLEREKSQFVR